MEVKPTPDTDDNVDVTLKFEEQNRNQLSFGAGVSQFDGFFGQLSFQTATSSAAARPSACRCRRARRRSQYQVSFSEPYLFDRPITVGADVLTRSSSSRSSTRRGPPARNVIFGVPVSDYTRLFTGYSYEEVSVSTSIRRICRAGPAEPVPAESLLLDQGGQRTVSKVSPSIVYNTVNQPMFPTAGTRYSAGFRPRRPRRQHEFRPAPTRRHLVPPGSRPDVVRPARARRSTRGRTPARRRCRSSRRSSSAASTTSAATTSAPCRRAIRLRVSSPAATSPSCSMPSTTWISASGAAAGVLRRRAGSRRRPELVW